MKHVEQTFPQLLGRAEVEGTAQPDDTAAGPRDVDAGHDDPCRSVTVVTVMSFSLASGQASGPATRKNTVA
jgi:hypothetical protein